MIKDIQMKYLNNILKLALFCTIGLTQAQNQNNYSLSFDGTDDYVEVPYSSTFNNFTDALSFSLWVKVTGGNGTHRNIIINGVQPGGFVVTVDDQNNFRPHIQYSWMAPILRKYNR